MRGSLFNSFIWPVPLLLVGVGLALTFEIETLVRQRTLHQAETSSQQTLTELRALRTYYSQKVVAKALSTKGLNPTLDYAKDPAGIPLPATFLHDAGKLMSGDARSVEVFSPYPFANRRDRSLSPVQQEAWEHLIRNPEETFVKSFTRDGHEFLMIGVADKMATETCVRCHNTHPESLKHDWKVGDVRAVLATIVPLAALQAQVSEIRAKIVLIVGLTLTAALVIYLLFVRKSSHRLRTAIASLTAAVQGKEVTKLPERRMGDEADDIADAVRSYLKNLQERDALAAQRYEDVRRHAAKGSALSDLVTKFDRMIQRSIEQVRDVARSLQRGSDALGSKSATLAQEASIAGQATKASADEIGTASEAVETLRRTLDSVADNARRSLESARTAANEANATRGTIAQMQDALQRIDGVVALIQGVASQTNLLALNATIEAARAGEAGRGFAVVAGEVKQLSAQTTRATDEISGEIDAIRAAFSKVAGSFDSVVGVIGRLSSLASEVDHAVESQVRDVGLLAASMANASESARSGYVAANSVDDASAATHGVSQEIRKLSERLADETAALERKVSEFLGSVQSTWGDPGDPTRPAAA